MENIKNYIIRCLFKTNEKKKGTLYIIYGWILGIEGTLSFVFRKIKLAYMFIIKICLFFIVTFLLFYLLIKLSYIANMDYYNLNYLMENSEHEQNKDIENAGKDNVNDSSKRTLSLSRWYLLFALSLFFNIFLLFYFVNCYGIFKKILVSIAEKNVVIANKDAIIEEQWEVLADQCQTITERDRELQELYRAAKAAQSRPGIR